MHSLSKQFFFLTIIASMMLAGSASALPFYVRAQASVRLDGNAFPTVSTSEDTGQVQAVSISTQNLSRSSSSADGSGNATANGSANLGSLHGNGQFVVGCSFNKFAGGYANGTQQWGDTVTFTSSTLPNGTDVQYLATLTMIRSLSGSNSDPGVSDPAASASASGPFGLSITDSLSSPNATQSVSIIVNTQIGVQQIIESQLVLGTNATVIGGGGRSGTVNVSSAYFTLQPITNGASYTTASGVSYADSDGDGTLDCLDGCPNDANKTAPGQCGCGHLDTDTDGDGTVDCFDGCPSDPNKIAPGECGCGTTETDADGDATPDCHDGCPNDSNKIAPGSCGCGFPEVPLCPAPCVIDTDSDGTLDCLDGCPNDPNKVAPDVCGCGVSEADSDGDGTPDCMDGCLNDANKIAPGQCGCGNSDTDSDGDGTPDCIDGCPSDPNKVAPGVCGCAIADTDTDADGVLDCGDDCPDTVPGVVVDVTGCPPMIYGDAERDGDVDMDDFEAFGDCLSGPAIPASPPCVSYDLDSDNDVDMDEFGIFQRCISGENTPADPACDD